MTPRRWRAAVGVLLAALVVVPIGSLRASAQEAVPKLDVVEALAEGRDITVTVVAPAGLRDAEVTEESFVIDIDGELLVPSVEPIAGDELDVVLLVDVSGSMTEEALAAARTSGEAFVRQLPAGSRVAVVSFGDEPILVQPFTTEVGEVVATLNALVASGETALHAAVVEAASLFDPTSESIRTVVLLSDGGNTVDESSLGNAQAAIVGSQATLYAISIQTDEANEAELSSLADVSGGRVARAEQVQEIEAIYSAIAVDLRNQYRLRFRANGQGEKVAVIRAQSGDRVLAETALVLDLPIPPPTPTPAPAPAIIPTLPTPVPAPPEASTPQITVFDAPDRTVLKWLSIAAVALAAAVIGMVLVTPGETRHRRPKPSERFEPVAVNLGQKRSGATGMIQHVADRLERLLGRNRLGPWISTRLDTAGWKVRNSEFILLVGLVSTFGFLSGAIRSLALGITLVVMCVSGFALVLALMAGRRRSAFAAQLNGTLQMMAGGLRTGYSLPQVIALVAEEAEAPTSEEFSRMTVEMRLGRNLIEAAEGVADRMGSADFRWTTGAIDIARDVGGDLAEVLDNVGATVRTREQVRRQISALSAEGRISAFILIALPFPIFFWQMLVNREYTMLLVNDPMGRTIFGVGVGLLIFGAFWLRGQIRVEY